MKISFVQGVLILVLILLLLASIGNEMTLVLPCAILVVLCKKPLRAWLDRYKRWIAFFGAGLCFGLLTESAAILANLDRPLAERALLNPYPAVDLALAVCWYGLFVAVWYFLCRKYRYGYGEIFLLAGAYGLIFEQKGIFIPMLWSWEFFFPLFIMAVYALFILVAYGLTKHRFTYAESTQTLWRFPAAFAGLALHSLIWKGAGLIYYPLLLGLGLLP